MEMNAGGDDDFSLEGRCLESTNCAEEVQLAMEEISSKEKEHRALVEVTTMLFDRSNEMAEKLEQQMV